jgi:hypothetical protein
MSAHIEGYGPSLDAVSFRIKPAEQALTPSISAILTPGQAIGVHGTEVLSLVTNWRSEIEQKPMTPEIAVSQKFHTSFLQRRILGSRELMLRPKEQIALKTRDLTPNEFGWAILGEGLSQNEKDQDKEVGEFLERFPYRSTELQVVHNRIMTPDEVKAAWKQQGFIKGEAINAIGGPVRTALWENNKPIYEEIRELRLATGKKKDDPEVLQREAEAIQEVLLLDPRKITDDGHTTGIDIGFMQGGMLIPLDRVPGLRLDHETVHRLLQPHKMSLTDTTLTWHMPSNPFAAQQAA